MTSFDVLRVLAEITASQWGMVTSAQAAEHGVSRLQLSRLAAAGLFERLAQGVYMDAGVPRSTLDELRAAWLSTDPKMTGEQRLRNLADGVVVASSSAAYLHEIGDLWADRHEFVSSRRRQSQRSDMRYRQRHLESRDVTLVAGLPTMTLERTIADLVEDVGDLSLVGDAVRDASLQRTLDLERLEALLNPLAARKGFAKDDGAALLQRLLEIAGIDEHSVAERIASNESLSSRVVEKYLDHLTLDAAQQLVRTPIITEVIAQITQDADHLGGNSSASENKPRTPLEPHDDEEHER